MTSPVANAFRKHEGYKGIWVSRCGAIFDATKKEVVTPKVTRWGYMVYERDGEMIYPHRLVCDLFVGPAPNPGMEVDFIDGIRSNLRADNLKWVELSELSTSTGTTPSYRTMYIKNIETGEEQLMDSVRVAAEYLQCTPDKVYRWLASDTRVPLEGRYDLRYMDTDYKGLTKEDLGAVVQGLPRRILAVDGKGNMSTYGSAALVAEGLGIHRETVGRHLRAGDNRKPIGRPLNYMLHYIDEYQGEIPSDTPDTPYGGQDRVVPVRKPKAITVTNISSGATEQYDSCEAFAAEIHMGLTTIYKAITQDSWRGLRIRYVAE